MRIGYLLRMKRHRWSSTRSLNVEEIIKVNILWKHQRSNKSWNEKFINLWSFCFWPPTHQRDSNGSCWKAKKVFVLLLLYAHLFYFVVILSQQEECRRNYFKFLEARTNFMKFLENFSPWHEADKWNFQAKQLQGTQKQTKNYTSLLFDWTCVRSQISLN